MFNLKSTICAALALTFAAGSAVPVVAAPAFVPTSQQNQAVDGNVVPVQMTRDQRQRRFERNENRRDNRFERRQDRREARFERRNGRAYYNGQRGYRDRRAGYRQHNGFWFPAGAFIAGAIISGAINSAQPSSNYGRSHVSWCENRWRSYRASDNSYQPYNGPRQRCVSPYS